jgi:NAD(P)-dependent dehydrogenase (short-subunit alcohol dehydrogenase family)
MRKTAVVTASYSGLGLELSKLLAANGFDIVSVNRNAAKSATFADTIRREFPDAKVDTVIADLSNHGSIRQAAADIAQRHPRIDALINNAGVLLGNLTFSTQRNEMHFEVNCVAPVMLLNLLRPQLAAAGRSVVLAVGSSAMAMSGKLDVASLRSPRRVKKLTGAYAQSKFAVTVAYQALAPQFEADGIKLRIGEPGPNKTTMTAGDGMPKLLLPIRNLFFAKPSVGAKRLYDAAFDPKFGERTGLYIEGGKEKTIPKSGRSLETRNEVLALLKTVGAL